MMTAPSAFPRLYQADHAHRRFAVQHSVIALFLAVLTVVLLFITEPQASSGMACR
jgi:hypothetical protein